MDDEKLLTLVKALTARLGRVPEEDEIIAFINGDAVTRERIWNQASAEAV